LLRGGLAAAPILMTVPSRSVMAYGDGDKAAQCVSPSSYMSVNPSGKDDMLVCDGRSPGYWKEHPKSWPPGYLPYGFYASTFQQKFDSSYFGRKTLMKVLEQEGNATGKEAVARHVVAALLNAENGLTSAVLPTAAVRRIWQEFELAGYYEPTAGIRWYADYSMPSSAGDGIVPYLLTTMKGA
jgi:hypothetical protein